MSKYSLLSAVHTESDALVNQAGGTALFPFTETSEICSKEDFRTFMFKDFVTQGRVRME